ncbi:MAG: hypothetical protein WDO13_01340 [Verrucomicrobiota bacterium]
MKTSPILGASGALLLALLASAPAAKAGRVPGPHLHGHAEPRHPRHQPLRHLLAGPAVHHRLRQRHQHRQALELPVPRRLGRFHAGIHQRRRRGSLSSGLTLTNSSLDNELAFALSSGVTAISFKVDQTPNSEIVGTGTPIPDQFNVALLDGDLDNLPTTDPSGGDALLSSVLGTNATLQTIKVFSGTGEALGVVAAVPEPSSIALSLLAAGRHARLRGAPPAPCWAAPSRILARSPASGAEGARVLRVSPASPTGEPSSLRKSSTSTLLNTMKKRLQQSRPRPLRRRRPSHQPGRLRPGVGYRHVHGELRRTGHRHHRPDRLVGRQ